MKTARDKAREFIYKNKDEDKSAIVDNLERLLKEQDRDTRHACAEAIITSKSAIIDVEDAHNICMNVKAV